MTALGNTRAPSHVEALRASGAADVCAALPTTRSERVPTQVENLAAVQAALLKIVPSKFELGGRIFAEDTPEAAVLGVMQLGLMAAASAVPQLAQLQHLAEARAAQAGEKLRDAELRLMGAQALLVAKATEVSILQTQRTTTREQLVQAGAQLLQLTEQLAQAREARDGLAHELSALEQRVAELAQAQTLQQHLPALRAAQAWFESARILIPVAGEHADALQRMIAAAEAPLALPVLVPKPVTEERELAPIVEVVPEPASDFVKVPADVEPELAPEPVDTPAVPVPAVTKKTSVALSDVPLLQFVLDAMSKPQRITVSRNGKTGSGSFAPSANIKNTLVLLKKHLVAGDVAKVRVVLSILLGRTEIGRSLAHQAETDAEGGKVRRFVASLQELQAALQP